MAGIKEQLTRKYLPKLIGAGLNTVGSVAPKKAAEIALDIFCTPRRGQIRSYQKKFLKQFKQKELIGNDLKVMTYDNGKKGKKVLLCHGWESNSFRWRKLYRALKDTDLNIIMMDAPAHGASGGEKFQALLYGQMIGLVSDHYQPHTIVGHSVGGYSTIYYMSKFQPEHVKDLVIMAAPDKLIDITQRYFDLIGLGRRVGRQYHGLINEKFGQPITTYNAADYASSIEAEGLIIHDKDDDVNLFYEAEAIHRSWHKSTLISTNGLGHSLQDEFVFDTIRTHITR